jgi:hypothetical protein
MGNPVPARQPVARPGKRAAHGEAEVADLFSFFDQMVASVAAGRGIDAVTGLLRQRVRAPVAILDLWGSVLVQSPARMSWPTRDILQMARDQERLAENDRADEYRLVPIQLDGHTVGLVCSTCGLEHLPMLRLGAGVIALEIGRLQANLSGHRELVAQLLEDVVAGAIPDWDARRRLSRHGVDTTRENRVIVGTAAAGAQRMASFPWNLHQLIYRQPEPYLRSMRGDRMVLVVPSGEEVEAVARQTHRHLRQIDGDAAVGVSRPHPGVSGIRVGLYEAIDALQGGSGVHFQQRLNLGSALILANPDLRMNDLAQTALRPLIDYDQQHAGNLVETLRTFLKHDCATAPAAEELFIHRNTLRYRLALIEKLTARDLTSFTDRVHFWLATALLSERDELAP